MLPRREEKPGRVTDRERLTALDRRVEPGSELHHLSRPLLTVNRPACFREDLGWLTDDGEFSELLPLSSRRDQALSSPELDFEEILGAKALILLCSRSRHDLRLPARRLPCLKTLCSWRKVICDIGSRRKWEYSRGMWVEIFLNYDCDVEARFVLYILDPRDKSSESGYWGKPRTWAGRATSSLMHLLAGCPELIGRRKYSMAEEGVTCGGVWNRVPTMSGSFPTRHPPGSVDLIFSSKSGSSRTPARVMRR